MNIEGTNVNPDLEVVPKVDVIGNQIAQVQANLEMLNDVLSKRIQITNQRDRDSIERMLTTAKEELAVPISVSRMIREGFNLDAVQEHRAETRGRISILNELLRSDKDLKEQITETENVLKSLLKKQQDEK